MALPRFPADTDNAVERFSPGRMILLKPLNDCPEVHFTSMLPVPGKESTTVLFHSGMGDHEHVLIEIYDPRYLEERITEKPCCKSHPWKLSNEQAAAMARAENSHLSDQELKQILHSHKAEELSAEDLATHNILWEEYCYRLVMGSYELNLRVYELLKEHEGPACPHLVMAGQFLPPENRAVRLPAVVTRHVPPVFGPIGGGCNRVAGVSPIYNLKLW